MKLKTAVTLSLWLFFPLKTFAQDEAGFYKWWNPAANDFRVVEGQGWPNDVKNPYDRLPARAQEQLRKDVWNISHQSAGLSIKFKTDANNIIIRYVVKGDLSMHHMPATGVSGMDLYAIDHDGNWLAAPANYSFGDTIVYTYNNIVVDSKYPGRDCEFRLYLPLYNTVQWIEIGVPESSSFQPMPLRREKPIVVYGTSIAQGACASRPGMAWTAILERKMDRPLTNLGFTGNGRLEKEVIDLMTEIDAKIYVLDCLPNLTANAGFSDEEVGKRIVESVKELRENNSEVPILLTEHSGGIPGRLTDTARVKDYEDVNKLLRRIFVKLKSDGLNNIYLLTNDEIDLRINATVDGLHPNDVGMEKHADAYEKSIRAILKEPVGEVSTTIPRVQSRDGNYDWNNRHQQILLLNKTDPPGMVCIGNSIIHYWGGNPEAPIVRGRYSWGKFLEPLKMRNLGFGWDRIENVLWRIYHGELDGFNAGHVVVMIGTNNVFLNSNEEIVEGLRFLIEAIKFRQPKAKVLLSGLLPRKELEERILVLNEQIATLAGKINVRYMDPGRSLLLDGNHINESLFSDGLHPNAAGYQKLAAALMAYLKN